jgi:hypothetical protein
MTTSRQTCFVEAVRALKQPCDNAIESTPYLGGGVRFSGFTEIKGRPFSNCLRAHGKKAIFRLNINGRLFVDCYDDIDPPVLQMIDPLSLTPTPIRTADDYIKGAVMYSPFRVASISSAGVQSVLLDLTVLDVVMTPDSVVFARVSSHSTNVVGGLHTQIQTNPRMRASRPGVKHSSTAFKPGVPCRRRRSKPLFAKLWSHIF